MVNGSAAGGHKPSRETRGSPNKRKTDTTSTVTMPREETQRTVVGESISSDKPAYVHTDMSSDMAMLANYMDSKSEVDESFLSFRGMHRHYLRWGVVDSDVLSDYEREQIQHAVREIPGNDYASDTLIRRVESWLKREVTWRKVVPEDIPSNKPAYVHTDMPSDMARLANFMDSGKLAPSMQFHYLYNLYLGIWKHEYYKGDNRWLQQQFRDAVFEITRDRNTFKIIGDDILSWFEAQAIWV